MQGLELISSLEEFLSHNHNSHKRQALLSASPSSLSIALHAWASDASDVSTGSLDRMAELVERLILQGHTRTLVQKWTRLFRDQSSPRWDIFSLLVNHLSLGALERYLVAWTSGLSLEFSLGNQSLEEASSFWISIVGSENLVSQSALQGLVQERLLGGRLITDPDAVHLLVHALSNLPDDAGMLVRLHSYFSRPSNPSKHARAFTQIMVQSLLAKYTCGCFSKIVHSIPFDPFCTSPCSDLDKLQIPSDCGCVKISRIHARGNSNTRHGRVFLNNA